MNSWSTLLRAFSDSYSVWGHKSIENKDIFVFSQAFRAMFCTQLLNKPCKSSSSSLDLPVKLLLQSVASKVKEKVFLRTTQGASVCHMQKQNPHRSICLQHWRCGGWRCRKDGQNIVFCSLNPQSSFLLNLRFIQDSCTRLKVKLWIFSCQKVGLN